MGEINFIIGGARSGKSQYAVKLAKRKHAKVAFIATLQPLDKEMKERIALHKKTRPAHWTICEEPQKVSALLKTIGNRYEVIIIDCLTILVSNLFLRNGKEVAIIKEINAIISCCKRMDTKAIIVANEVGLGIVPDNKLSRNFRDIAGRVNQLVAENSDKLFFMVAGVPFKIKNLK